MSAPFCNHKPRKPWRLLFNWDGGGVFDMPGWVTDPKEFRQKAVRSFLRAGADAISYSIYGASYVRYNSEFCEYHGQFDQTFYHVNQWEGSERQKRRIASGRFPFVTLIEEGHKVGLDILASFRMNDTHDKYFSPQTPLDGMPLAHFKRTHPELLIEDDQGWTKYCLNFSHKAVRDHIFNLTREVVERFDVDGVELDFMRNGFFFRKGEERKNAPLMTNLIQRIRLMLDETGTRRKKQLHLAVHTPVTQEVSLNCGLDVVAWIKEGLVNQAVADEGCTPFKFTPDDFIRAARKCGSCKVYSTVDIGCAPPERLEAEKGLASPAIPWNEEQLRGWAVFQMKSGIDGLNLFNGHFEKNPDMLSRVFGNDKVWKDCFPGDKTFVAQNIAFTLNMPRQAIPEEARPKLGQWPTGPLSAYPPTGNSKTNYLPMNLEKAKGGQGQEMEIFVPDDLPAVHRRGILKSVILRMVFSQLTVEDELIIKVNNRPVASIGKRGSAQKLLVKNPHQKISEGRGERLFPIKPRILKPGENVIETVLRYRNPKIAPPIIWQTAEIRIRYNMKNQTYGRRRNH